MRLRGNFNTTIKCECKYGTKFSDNKTSLIFVAVKAKIL